MTVSPYQQANGIYTCDTMVHITPQSGVATISGGTGTITNGLISMSSGDGWNQRSPKADKIDTVKLTKDNLESIGKSLVVIEGFPVKVGESHIVYGDEAFSLGDWLVREWNYSLNLYKYRLATFSEREKYDLR